MAWRVFLLLLGTVLALGQDAPCSGHGQHVEGKCVCSSPLPADDASPGFVGDACATPVHRLFLNGQDVAETCAAGHLCNVVAPGAPVCFATSIADLSEVAYHLTLLLASNSVDAAVTLRGLLTNFTATTDPATNATTTAPQAYPNGTASFSFAVHTTHDAPASQLQLTRRQLGYGAYTGLYLCAESTASTTIVLRGASHSCPFTLLPNGTLQLCKGRGTTDTCPHGSCACPPPYAPPPNWVETAGLGFDDCTATLQPLQPSAAAADQPPIPASLPVAAQAPGAWAFFVLEVPATGAFEVHVTAAATEATTGSLAVYLRYQQLPGEGESQHDAASDTSSSSSSWWRDASAHVVLRRGDTAFRPGTWYVGVYNKGAGPVTHSVTGALYGCPNNCSGRGACAADTATCTCSQATSLGPDCSVSLYELSLGAPFVAEPRPFLSFDRLVLRGVKAQLKSAATQRLALTASFTTNDETLPAWVAGRPVVMVVPSADASANATGGSGSGVLWPDGAAERMALAAPGAQYSMSVGPWMVAEDDALHVVVWNPLSGPPCAVGYSLALAAAGACLRDCSGHGACDTTTGLCACQDSFAGGDCSVDLSQFNTTGGGAVCAAGSLRPAHRDELRGTCWQPCKADGSGYDEATCADFTCDGPGGGHGQLRRRGAAQECVEDACVAGNYTVTDPSGDFACTRPCACPEDGGACGLAAACLPGSVVCLKGLRLAADAQTCVAPPACEEGNLRRAYDLEGGGGSAFALCACAAPGDASSCAFTSPSQAAGNAGGVVSCLPGFERAGTTAPTRLSDGSSIVTGGGCVAAQHGGGGGGDSGSHRRHGVSGGMVFFYCLLSIALAAGLIVGGKYGLLWYENYKYGRSVFGQGYVSWPLFGNRANAGGGADDW